MMLDYFTLLFVFAFMTLLVGVVDLALTIKIIFDERGGIDG